MSKLWRFSWIPGATVASRTLTWAAKHQTLNKHPHKAANWTEAEGRGSGGERELEQGRKCVCVPSSPSPSLSLSMWRSSQQGGACFFFNVLTKKPQFSLLLDSAWVFSVICLSEGERTLHWRMEEPRVWTLEEFGLFFSELDSDLLRLNAGKARTRL